MKLRNHYHLLSYKLEYAIYRWEFATRCKIKLMLLWCSIYLYFINSIGIFQEMTQTRHIHSDRVIICTNE